jgi:uncharacterized protein YdbL (DUF1318 family)
MRFALLLVGVAMLATAGGAQESVSVVQARGAGLIGERFDGYVGFVTNPSDSLRRQVNAINIRRRALYSNLARQKGVSAQEVGITATCTLFTRIPVGGYYLTSDRGWLRRGVGQAAPRPAYCG